MPSDQSKPVQDAERLAALPDAGPRNPEPAGFLRRSILAGGLLLLFGLPFVLLLLLALGQYWRFPDVLPPVYALDALTRVVSADSALATGFLLSLLIATVVAVVSTAGGFVVARAIAGASRPDRWVTLSYLPYALPPVLLAVLIQPYFIRLHLSGSLAGVVLGLLLITIPFAALFFRSFWGEQAKQYEQLSRTLGCTQVQAFRWVLLPLARPLLITCLFQTFLIAWFDFGLTNYLSVGKVQTLTVQVFIYVGEANSRLAAVASLLLLIPPALLLWVNRKAIVRRVF
ncbi:ABC transporter permease subunit [Fibrisoma montanum]|uniref:ABC transporter permease subunit n=1 Tax=Fibrisoma montanum TaxID=2305895 RepID=A0A418M5J4_9BACT|nr:ABC transporter permease subunit [Fibrisoma montanum]RIV21132.1 ABC transporter permease subunit [Fibrisoma montanum]